MAAMQMDQALADAMVEEAIHFCADKKFNGDVNHTLKALRSGRCDACEYLSYSLVKQIGSYLGNLDRTVKAVYVFKPDRAPHTVTGPTSGRRSSGINLIAWVDRKSAALTALGDTLEKALSQSRMKIGCVRATPACCNLDVYMVDDDEVQEGRGMGAIILSMYVRSVQVWTRLEQDNLLPLPVSNVDTAELLLSLNPEMAPEEMLFEQALAMENMLPQEQSTLKYRLEEVKVVLLRKIISDHLAYINVAKDWLSVADLIQIRRSKIGYGKIGGKSAGLLLAAAILKQNASKEVFSRLVIPESYFLGSDLIYVYTSTNGLTHWNEQKYKPPEQLHADYPRIQAEFQEGSFPPDVLEKLQDMLDEIGPRPIIVRSSSQLEDSFGTSFAGKYDSFFLPNQGTRQENLRALTQAIARTYASTLKPDALLYRRSKGLLDYDERMAVLVQVVQGETYGRYFLPHAAGVAFSRNLYRWSPEIRREDGFARLVWGLGTRAVERVGNDYPRLVAMSHPTLHPDDSPEAIRYYSQQYVDLLDLEENTFKTLSIREVLAPQYPALRYLAEIEQDGYFSCIRSRITSADIARLALTFTELIRRTPFTETLIEIMRILEQHYHSAVDLEFTLQILDPFSVRPEIQISLLQCRPQSHLKSSQIVSLPTELSHQEIIFSTDFMVPQGYVTGIQKVLFVSPESYYALDTPAKRKEVGRLIGKLSSLLPDKSFICVGPGRWGTANPDLGVYVGYSDIHNASALIELSGQGVGPAPEPSLGTHFFQDLMEAEIYPLAVLLDKKGTIFNREFFYQTPNRLCDYLPEADGYRNVVRLIEIDSYRPGCHLDLIMDDEKGQAVAFLAPSTK